MGDDADCCTEQEVGLELVVALAEGEGDTVLVDDAAGDDVPDELEDAAGDDVPDDDVGLEEVAVVGAVAVGIGDAVIAVDGEEDCEAAAPSETGIDVITVRPMAVLHSRWIVASAVSA